MTYYETRFFEKGEGLLKTVRSKSMKAAYNKITLDSPGNLAIVVAPDKTVSTYERTVVGDKGWRYVGTAYR